MPELQFLAPDPLPASVQRLNNLLRQRTLVQSCQILLKVLRATRANNDGITLLSLQLCVMRQPPKCTFRLRQPVLLCYRTDDVQCVKVEVVPIAATVQLALHSVRVESATLFDILRVAVITVRQEAAGKWGKIIQRHAVVAETREQLGFNGTV